MFNKKRFCALNNISIVIKEGESVAIIGPNGSGKSTLLMILGEILVPTSGKYYGFGKTVPILQSGIDFKEDLTVRENIYLYATIFGISRKDISKKLHSILTFAELEDNIDELAKNLSAGMKLRLAFSIVIHSKPDILLFDEILNFVDISFSKKCISFFNDWKKRNKTLIFVSHDLALVKKYFKRTIYLSKGEVVIDGPTDKVIKKYLSDVSRIR